MNSAAGADGALWVRLGDFFSGGRGLARFHEGSWQVFTTANSGLPHDNVHELAVGADGALWAGTDQGLARFHEGSWQVFTRANSVLPSDKVLALAAGADDALWIGTSGGLASFSVRGPRPVLSKIETLAEIHQSEHTFAVRGFDRTYRTPTHLLRYEWTVNKHGAKDLLSRRTSEPYYTVRFPEDGFYSIKVQATDRYGWPSNIETFDVEATLPNKAEQPWWKSNEARVGAPILAAMLYLMLLLPFVSLYPRFSWVRSLVNSGVFTKFPVMHRLLLNTSWARRCLFALYRSNVIGAPDVSYYIEQSVFPLPDGEPLPIGREEDPLGELAKQSRFSLVLGRSGTGKSILLTRIHRTAAARFGRGHADLPILVNAPTHLAGGETLMDAVKTVLRRDGKVELPESILDFLISKGGFLVLVDSLNECPKADKALTSFLNADANNIVVVASQIDTIQHPDMRSYRLAEVTANQARSYLDARVEAGTWDKLSPLLRALAHNPKDLDLIAEVIDNLGVEMLPSRRADLYAERLKADTGVKAWVDNADPRLEIVYGLAYRMLAERRRVLELPTFAQWVKEELSACHLAAQEVDAVTEVLRRSRQFRQVKTRDRLGRDEEAITFDHELVGKFLAARQVRAMLEGASRSEALSLATDEAWLDVFFFVIDEAGAHRLPELLLDELIDRSGAIPLALVAYAIKTKSDEQLPPEVREKYGEARLREDVKLTPAA